MLGRGESNRLTPTSPPPVCCPPSCPLPAILLPWQAPAVSQPGAWGQRSLQLSSSSSGLGSGWSHCHRNSCYQAGLGTTITRAPGRGRGRRRALCRGSRARSRERAPPPPPPQPRPAQPLHVEGEATSLGARQAPGGAARRAAALHHGAAAASRAGPRRQVQSPAPRALGAAALPPRFPSRKYIAPRGMRAQRGGWKCIPFPLWALLP